MLDHILKVSLQYLVGISPDLQLKAQLDTKLFRFQAFSHVSSECMDLF